MEKAKKGKRKRKRLSKSKRKIKKKEVKTGAIESDWGKTHALYAK